MIGVEYTSPKTGARNFEAYETAKEARECLCVYRGSRERGGHDYAARIVATYDVEYTPPNGTERERETFDRLGDAVEMVREMARPGSNRGRFPQLIGAGFTATPGKDGQGRSRWHLGFPREVWKSSETHIAESAGVRYASHRTGYVASERAFGRFLAGIERLDSL